MTTTILPPPDDTARIPLAFASSLHCDGCPLCRVEAVHPRSECADPPTLQPDGGRAEVSPW